MSMLERLTGRAWSALGLALLVAALASCAPTADPRPGSSASSAQISARCSSASQPVTIGDPALAAAVARELGIASEAGAQITCGDMAQLNRLLANDVSSLGGIEFAENLRDLTLRRSSVSSLQPLSGLGSLHRIEIQGTSLESFDSLTSAPALEVLESHGNPIDDIATVARFPRITSLTVVDASVSDISVLAGLANLYWLDLSGNAVTDISALSNLATLTILHLNGNQVTDASPLASAPRLNWLEMNDNLLTDIDFIEFLDLNVLRLSGNRISSITGLARNQTFGSNDRYDLRNNCIDLGAADPFVVDLLARGASMLIEPQNPECVAE